LGSARYADLFAVNINAQTLSKNDLIGKFKTLSQGSFSESVLDKMATTFQSLVKLADFSAPSSFSTSSFSPPRTKRSPRLTRVSLGKPLRRLDVRSKAAEVGAVVGMPWHCPSP
jgi:hypothetical protein